MREPRDGAQAGRTSEEHVRQGVEDVQANSSAGYVVLSMDRPERTEDFDFL